MGVYDDTASDVLRLIEMVLHRSTGTGAAGPTALAVSTYATVSAQIDALDGGVPDRAWVLSIAHSLARRSITGAEGGSGEVSHTVAS